MFILKNRLHQEIDRGTLKQLSQKHNISYYKLRYAYRTHKPVDRLYYVQRDRTSSGKRYMLLDDDNYIVFIGTAREIADYIKHPDPECAIKVLYNVLSGIGKTYYGYYVREVNYDRPFE